MRCDKGGKESFNEDLSEDKGRNFNQKGGTIKIKAPVFEPYCIFFENDLLILFSVLQ